MRHLLIYAWLAYCHTPHEWEKDDKQAKPTSRKMFEMIAGR